VNEAFVLKWDRLCIACQYQIQIKNADKTAAVFTGYAVNESIGKTNEELMANPAAPSYVVPKGKLDCSKTYYWRVRVIHAETGEDIRSPWSSYRAFTVAAGPGGAIALTAPDEGAADVPIENVSFTWTNVQDATRYEFVLSSKPDMSAVVVKEPKLTGTAYQLAATLEYSSPYYWQVTAIKDANTLSKSSISTFTTVSKPVPPPVIPETPKPTTPAWVWVVIGIGAVLVIVVIVLIFRTRRV
jgi:hypothetical protein